MYDGMTATLNAGVEWKCFSMTLHFFQQCVGISMGTICTPLYASLIQMLLYDCFIALSLSTPRTFLTTLAYSVLRNLPDSIYKTVFCLRSV
jgi:hypothetical protein